MLPAKAPDPSSLIPGLNSQGPVVAAAAPSFPPIPRYSYTSFASRAVPVPGHRLEAFPHIPKWEDATAANKLIAEKYQSFLPFEVEDDPIPDLSSPEFDWLRDALPDLHAFRPPDNGRELILPPACAFMVVSLLTHHCDRQAPCAISVRSSACSNASNQNLRGRRETESTTSTNELPHSSSSDAELDALRSRSRKSEWSATL